ncbi:hypothetical protein K2A10_004728 [Salmonella enterica subsp. enterica serovar Concord]|nr:hypothetical protein [Salmonella enterica subsp. enterica serovar Concord]
MNGAGKPSPPFGLPSLTLKTRPAATIPVAPPLSRRSLRSLQPGGKAAGL